MGHYGSCLYMYQAMVARISWSVGVWLLLSGALWGALSAAARAVPISAERQTYSQTPAIEMTDEIAEEIPEEILRTEIITEARSPLTGEPLSAAEYAQIQAELTAPASAISDDIRYLIFLLQVRRAIKPIVPFLN